MRRHTYISRHEGTTQLPSLIARHAAQDAYLRALCTPIDAAAAAGLLPALNGRLAGMGPAFSLGPLLCSFLLAVTQFVVPTFAFVKNRPIPYVTHDIALTGEIRGGLLLAGTCLLACSGTPVL